MPLLHLSSDQVDLLQMLIHYELEHDDEFYEDLMPILSKIESKLDHGLYDLTEWETFYAFFAARFYLARAVNDEDSDRQPLAHVDPEEVYALVEERLGPAYMACESLVQPKTSRLHRALEWLQFRVFDRW